jgi:8-oxo-dGTP diphosphatase
VNRSDRLYPDRPIVGVGGVIVVDSSCRIDGMPATLPSPAGVVLVQRRFEPQAGAWSLPGGALEVGETLAAGVAREVREETGLIVDVGDVVDVFDRILLDEQDDDPQRVRHHYVLLDYLCRPTGGRLQAGSDAADVRVVHPDGLAAFHVSPLVEAVVRRALAMVG